MSTSILVANRTGARLFHRTGKNLRLLWSLENPAGRLRDQDIEAGASKRTYDSHARGHDPATSPHEQAAVTFAKELAEELRRERLRGGANRIVLVAEPHFLGLLRGELDVPTGARVIAMVTKDLEHAALDSVAEHVQHVPDLEL